MAIACAPPRKILEVDVLEDDGLHTRGYVQDVLKDGRVVIYFDRADDPLQPVEAAKVFKLREISRKAEFLGKKDQMEVLVKRSSNVAARWYPAEVVYRDGRCTLMDFLDDRNRRRRGIFDTSYPSKTIQKSASRLVGNYRVERLDVSVSRRDLSKGKTSVDLDDWEKKTKTLLKSVDVDRCILEVVLSAEQQLPTESFLRRMLVFGETGSDSDDDTARKRSADSETESAPGRKKRKLRNESAAPEMFCDGWQIPELLVKIFRNLGLSDRHTLRGVCCEWKNLMDASLVCGSLHFDDTEPRWEMTAPLVDRVRFLSRLHYDRLTAISVHCTDSLTTKDDPRTFAWTLPFVSPVLLPHLKTVTLYSGKLDSSALLYWLEMRNPPRILLRNVRLYRVMRIMLGTWENGMHLYIASADLVYADIVAKVELNEEERSISRELYGDKCNTLLMAGMRHFLAGELDRIPLRKQQEEEILIVAESADPDVRGRLMLALKTQDGGFFRRTTLTALEGSFRIAPSVLRKATLHLFRAILMGFSEKEFSCADQKCCSKFLTTAD